MDKGAKIPFLRPGGMTGPALALVFCMGMAAAAAPAAERRTQPAGGMENNAPVRAAAMSPRAAAGDDETRKTKDGKASVQDVLEACVAGREKTIKRLEGLRGKLIEFRKSLSRREQAGRQAASVWKKAVTGAVDSWISRNASPARLGLLDCERFDEPRLAEEDGRLTLVLSGRVKRPGSIRKRFERLKSLFPDLMIDDETLRGLVDGCTVEVAGTRIEEDSVLRTRDYEELEAKDLPGLPSGEDCSSGRAGRDLEQLAKRGKVKIPDGKVTGFWVNAGGDFGLCIHDDAGWYVQDNNLDGFSGLYLRGAGG